MQSQYARPLERRSDQVRRRTLLAGKLVGRDGSVTLDCTIRNMSPGGAMVETPSPQMTPHALYLVQVKDGVAYDVEVAWRRGPRLGLVLTDRHDLKQPVADQLRTLRLLWGQMAPR